MELNVFLGDGMYTQRTRRESCSSVCSHQKNREGWLQSTNYHVDTWISSKLEVGLRNTQFHCALKAVCTVALFRKCQCRPFVRKGERK